MGSRKLTMPNSQRSTRGAYRRAARCHCHHRTLWRSHRTLCRILPQRLTRGPRKLTMPNSQRSTRGAYRRAACHHRTLCRSHRARRIIRCPRRLTLPASQRSTRGAYRRAACHRRTLCRSHRARRILPQRLTLWRALLAHNTRRLPFPTWTQTSIFFHRGKPKMK